MERTTSSSDYVNTSAVGYVVNTLLTESSQRYARQIQNIFVRELGDTVWIVPQDALHITLLDWIAPLVEYSDIKDSIFRKIHKQYREALEKSLGGIGPINVTFNDVIVSPSAVAIIADQESTAIFNHIRQTFLSSIEPLPDTKQPPNIIHSTILRFIGEVDLARAQEIASTLDFSFVMQIDNFQLVRETKLPMLDYSVIKKYAL